MTCPPHDSPRNEPTPWQDPPASPSLNTGELHLWRFSTAAHSPALAALLTDSEREQAASLKLEKVRLQYSASRACLRHILSLYTGLPPADLTFTTNACGKPALADAPGPAFNLTHSGGLGLIAVFAGTTVGVDIEHSRRKDKLAGIAARVFSQSELATWQALTPAAQPGAFYRLWTIKEAVLKAAGCGFSVSPAEMDTGACITPPPGLERLTVSLPGHGSWEVTAFSAADGYPAAVAVPRGTPPTLAFFTFENETPPG